MNFELFLLNWQKYFNFIFFLVFVMRKEKINSSGDETHFYIILNIGKIKIEIKLRLRCHYIMKIESYKSNFQILIEPEAHRSL